MRDTDTVQAAVTLTAAETQNRPRWTPKPSSLTPLFSIILDKSLKFFRIQPIVECRAIKIGFFRPKIAPR